MSKENLSVWSNWRYDVPASVVVLLVALPLCLGIALASGAPLFSGIIAGVVGGIVVGALSKSPLSISGPAAGLTVIVLDAIQALPSFNAFLLAVCLAGAIQMVLGFARAGVIGDFIPSTVIKGMLAAIGIILILKQIPHAIGYDESHHLDYAFQGQGENTFTALAHMLQSLNWGAVIISVVSLAFLFFWDKQQPKFKGVLRYIPGALLVVIFGVAANEFFKAFMPELALTAQSLVSVPVAESVDGFLSQFTLPDFNFIESKEVWITAITLALVASVETLLSIEAIDRLDPFKRTTPTNRELFAQGAGNMLSGAIGGLPVTSVIVRSSANTAAGGRTQMSAILHGLMLLGCVIAIPYYLNFIPLAALAAVLISVGYKLTKPRIFLQKYEKGWAYFVPFVVTIIAILLTDLLVGIAIGVVVGAVFVIWENFRSAVLYMVDDNNHLVRLKKDLFFIHKYELKKTFSQIPDDCKVLLDLSRVNYIDLDNVEIINDFIETAHYRGIHVTVKNNLDIKTNYIQEPNNAAL